MHQSSHSSGKGSSTEVDNRNNKKTDNKDNKKTDKDSNKKTDKKASSSKSDSSSSQNQQQLDRIKSEGGQSSSKNSDKGRRQDGQHSSTPRTLSR